MELQSARDLKAEVLQTIVYPFIKASLELEPHEATKKLSSMLGLIVKPLSLAAGPLTAGFHRSFALGIAPSGKGFKLAVRLQRQGLANSPLLQEIVKRAMGEVEVRLIGRVEKRHTSESKIKPLAAQPWFQGDSRPLIIGSSIAHMDVTAGTLGAFVTKNGIPYVLSNNHVLANENAATVGDTVLQRSPADGGVVGKQDAAVLSEWIPLNIAGPTPVDAAIAELKLSDFDPSVLRGVRDGKNAKLAGLATGTHVGTVYKLGRTTNSTVGKITALDMDNIVVTYAPGNVQFNDSIEIESSGAEPFSDGGDSGSLILNEQMEAIGLLYAGTETGGANGLGLTYAHHLNLVLNNFGVQLMT